ncbi:MAG: hypothetical protein QM496_14840 [Verrucomicrobiota bacterium]
MKFIIYSFLTASCFFVSGFAQEELPEPPELPDGIVMESYKSRQTGSGDFKIYLRYPSSGKDSIKGVLAICKYSDRGLATDLAGSTRHFGYLLNFADRHQLATIGFSPPGRGWDRTANSDMLSRRNAIDQDKNLDGLARDLSRSIDRFAGKYRLPKSDWLLYGLCGGAQYAHRMALRQPQYFKAVHVHYGGSYDVPTPKAKSIQWLVTSHADEPAYIAAQRFYRQCREMDYRMILKGYTRSNAPEEYDPDMAYSGITDLQKLSMDFFEHALINKGKVELSQSYIADYVNGLVVPAAEGQWIPKSQAVILPTRKLAEAWGPISE